MKSTSQKRKSDQDLEQDKETSSKMSLKKEADKNDMPPSTTSTPPPPPPLPLDSDIFKTTLNAELFRTKFRKSLPRDTDEETTRSFDAVVNELKSKFTKIRINLEKSERNQPPTEMENIVEYDTLLSKKETSQPYMKSQGTKSSNAIGIYGDICDINDVNNGKRPTQSFSNIGMKLASKQHANNKCLSLAKENLNANVLLENKSAFSQSEILKDFPKNSQDSSNINRDGNIEVLLSFRLGYSY